MLKQPDTLRAPFSTVKGEVREPPPDYAVTTWMLAQKQYNERYGGFIRQRNVMAAFLAAALVIILTLAIGLIALSMQSKLIPYIVAVDKLGNLTAVKRADIPARPDERMIRAALATWIQNIRTVYTDMQAQDRLLTEAAAMLNPKGQAKEAIKSYFASHDPFKRAKTETVSVDVESVLPLSHNTFQVQWRETIHNSESSAANTILQQAVITVSVHPPMNEATLFKNPLGIYIDHFSWSERL